MVTAHHRYISREVEGQTTLVRDFEGMYRDVDDPHGQGISADNGSHRIYLEIMHQLLAEEFATGSDIGAAFRYIDVGCGLGHFTQRVTRRLRDMARRRVRPLLSGRGRQVAALGIDISQVAIEKARANQPDYLEPGRIDFAQASLLNAPELDVLGEFDLVTCFETLSYFTDDEISEVMDNLGRLVRPGGHLVLTYHLPSTMSYGRYITGLDDMHRYFTSFETVWEMDFTDNLSRIYDGSPFGHHLFCAMRRPLHG